MAQAVAAIVLLYGGLLVFRGEMDRADLVSFMLYQQALASTMDILGTIFSSIMAAIGAATEVIRLLDRQPRMPPAGTRLPIALTGRLELEDVHFAYPSRPDVRSAMLPCSRRALCHAALLPSTTATFLQHARVPERPRTALLQHL